MPEHHTRPAQNAPVALLMLLVVTIMFSFGDMLSKMTVVTIHPTQIFFVRCVIVASVVVPAVYFRKGRSVFHSERPKTQIFRGICILLSSLLFVSGLYYLPLADANALNAVWPLLITVLSVFFLGEKVGIRRWVATIVGFCGMLLIIRPGTSAFQAAALLPLLSAFTWSMATLTARSMSAHDRAETTIVWSSLVMLAGSCLLVPFYWVQPTMREWALMGAIGIVSIIGHSLMVFAYERASASFLAPFSYTQLLWSVTFGYLAFGAVPDSWMAAGACLIVGSGIYTAHREHVRAGSGQ
ncbi:RhaT Permeases of the drug/metabolite transporter (DMT) superfamily [Rhabdaerophilaceae bacterium]